MSDGYIVSEGNVRDLFDKDGNFLGTNQDHWSVLK